MPRHRSSDRGLTLIELLVVVTLIGIVATSLAAVITVFIRNEGSVSNRLTDTRDLQNLTNFLPGDFASANLVQSDVENGENPDVPKSDPASSCGSGGDVLLHLEWTEFWTTQYSHRVTYRVEPSAGAPQRIVRYSCENELPPSSFVVARSFSNFDIELPTVGGDLNGSVEISLTYLDGDVKRVTATSRHFLP